VALLASDWSAERTSLPPWFFTNKQIAFVETFQMLVSLIGKLKIGGSLQSAGNHFRARNLRWNDSNHEPLRQGWKKSKGELND
jgi:hypothetical protein